MSPCEAIKLACHQTSVSCAVTCQQVRREVVMAAWSTVVVVSLVFLHHSRAASESELLSNFRRCQRVCNRVLSNTSLLGVVVGVGENLQNATATVGTGIRGGIQGVATGVRQGTAAVVENVRKNIQAVRNGIRPNRYPEDDYKENSPEPPPSDEQFYVVPAP